MTLNGTQSEQDDLTRYHHIQALLRPSFKKVNTEDTDFFEAHFQELLQVMPNVNDFSGLIDVDLQPLFLRMTLDSATELLLGESFHSQLSHSEPETKAFVDSFDFATRNVYKYDALNNGFLSPLGMLDWALRGGGKDKFTKSCEAVHRAIDDKITQRLQEGFGAADAKKYIFLEGLSQETDDKAQIRDEILSVLFAGRDSTGSLLSNAMFMLARKPDVWDQLREEVMRVTQGELPDASMLRQMKFLRNVLTESTCNRPYHPLERSGIFRTCNELTLHSPPTIPTHPGKRPGGKRQHYTTTRWRPRRPRPIIRRSRNSSSIPLLRGSSIVRNLRSYRSRMESITLGRPFFQTRLGISAVSTQDFIKKKK
jgi:hypothetical protein